MYVRKYLYMLLYYTNYIKGKIVFILIFYDYVCMYVVFTIVNSLLVSEYDYINYM